MGGEKESGRARAEQKSSKLRSQHGTGTPQQQCAVSAPVATVNQLQGPHVLRLDWDRKPLAEAVVPTKVGSREYGYGSGPGHRNLRTVGPPKTVAAECRCADSRAQSSSVQTPPRSRAGRVAVAE